MKITDVTYVQRQGYPFLRMKIDGIETQVTREQSALLVREGIVFVGSALKDKLSVEFRGQILQGCTNDPEIFAIVNAFGLSVRDGYFEPDEIID
jgi:hypothetical protein